jgi:hypothetical protein
VKFFLKFVFVGYIVFAIGICENQVYAQKKNSDWPVHASTTSSLGLAYNATPVSVGYILLKNGDTLRGRIKLLVYYSPIRYISFVPEGKNNSWDVVDIQREKINYVRLYSDSLRNGINFTDFVNFENKDLWRLIKENENVKIYDNYNPVDGESFGEKMILLSGGNNIKIYGNTIFGTDNVSRRLLRFINRRYNQKLDSSFFPDDNAMINYILTKEDERNRNNPDKH